MSTPQHLEFDASPSVLKAYSKMLLPRGGSEVTTLPELSATLRNHLPNYGDVRAYEEICGLPYALGSQAHGVPGVQRPGDLVPDCFSRFRLVRRVRPVTHCWLLLRYRG